MKMLAAIVFAGVFVFGTAACAKEEPKKAAVVEISKAPVVESVVEPVVVPIEEEKVAEPKKTKRVCIDQKDPKTGKVREVCKTIKIHKKFEGTKVPEKAPKK